MSNKKAKRAPTRQRVSSTRVEVPSAGEVGQAPPSSRERTIRLLVVALKITVGTALVISLSGGMALALHRYARSTPRFAITDIAVEGTRRLLREEVLGAAQIELGHNIFVLDAARAERRLLESPWIKRARVSRRLPGHVRVEILEREPVALAVIGSETFLVSQEGEPFKRLGVGDPHDLPLVTGLSLAELSRDRRAELARLEEALRLLRDYEELSVGRELPPEEVHLTETGMAVLTVGPEGRRLHLGPAPYKGKLLRVAKILDKTKRQGGSAGVVFLDNSAHPERVVVRLR